MDDSITVVELLNELIDSRVQFFSRCLNGIPHANRSNALGSFLATESMYLSLIDQIHRAQTRSNLVANIITWATVPNGINNNAMESVRVVASAEQIAASMQQIPSSESNCAICQEAIRADGARIRQCGHDYHRPCLLNWLNMSVRCPVCRHDIREPNPNATGHLAQTSSAGV